MDQAARDVKREPAAPKDKKDNRDNPKHRSSPFSPTLVQAAPLTMRDILTRLRRSGARLYVGHRL